MEKTNFVISNPCNADWNKMTPSEIGRNCRSCKTTVVDFTSMTVEQINNYLNSKKNEKVCGHFYNKQIIVSRPKHHQFLVDLYFEIENNFTLPLLKTFTLSFVILCMTIVGCNRPVMTNELAIKEKSDLPFQTNKIVADTPAPESHHYITNGRVSRPITKDTATAPKETYIVNGMIIPIENDTTKK